MDGQPVAGITPTSHTSTLEKTPGIAVLGVKLRVYLMLPLTRIRRIRPSNSRITDPECHQLDGRTICLDFCSKGALTTGYHGARLPLSDVEFDAFEIMHLDKMFEEVMPLWFTALAYLKDNEKND